MMFLEEALRLLRVCSLLQECRCVNVGVHLRSDPLHHPWGGRLGSSPLHEHVGGDPTNGCVQHTADLQVVLTVSDGTDDRHARDQDLACFTAWQLQLAYFPSRAASWGKARAARNVRATTGVQLDVVHNGPQWNVRQVHRMSHFGRGVLAAVDGHPWLQAVGSNDVALLTVLVFDKADVAGAVGVVFDRQHGRLHVLVALEVVAR